MADVVNPETRSRMMAGIRGRNTMPEVALRQALHHRGFRFRLHDRSLPARPDIVLARWKAAVLVHGCFWHRHPGCKYTTIPTTRPDFWIKKFADNVERDTRDHAALLEFGWRVATVWECALRAPHLQTSANVLSKWIQQGDDTIDIGRP